MSPRQVVAILDFGSQYTQLIARRVRECGVFTEILAPERAAECAGPATIAYVLSGGPNSVYEPGAPVAPRAVLESGKPILAICYGMHLLAHQLGGRMGAGSRREYGQAAIELTTENPLTAGLPRRLPVWMSHGDHIAEIPPGFSVLARSENGVPAAIGRGNIFGLQFHPEVVHTPDGGHILRNFLFFLAGAAGDWTIEHVIDGAVARIREQVGAGRAICGLSGGVDSAVAASLTHRAIGDRLTCVLVDHGLMRRGEVDEVRAAFAASRKVDLVIADASERFLDRLRDVIDPEEKRRRIGHEFVRVFEHEASRLSATRGQYDYLVQGTLYPDVIESAGSGHAQTIKTHHNVGGLPDHMEFDIIEPLRDLFKDEVRRVGEALGIPEEIVWRHPFPGPGLAIRIIGEVTPDRLETLRTADAIVTEELRASGWYRQCSQALAVLTPIRTVGVMGDGRTYGNVLAIRAVTTDDFMTADWARLPHDLLARMASRVVNEVQGVTRVVYDISSKPPATIEWE